MTPVCRSETYKPIIRMRTIDPERPFILLTQVFNTGDHLDSATGFIVDWKSILNNRLRRFAHVIDA